MYVCDAFLLEYISPYISKVQSHFWLKFGRVISIYGALMLLNFCGDWRLELISLNLLGFQIEENFGKQSFRCLSKIKFGLKNFYQNHPRPQKIKQMTKYSFFFKFFFRND